MARAPPGDAEAPDSVLLLDLPVEAALRRLDDRPDKPVHGDQGRQLLGDVRARSTWICLRMEDVVVLNVAASRRDVLDAALRATGTAL